MWSTKRLEELPPGAMLEVEVDGGARLIAFDPLGCGDGEKVDRRHGLGRGGLVRRRGAADRALIIGSIDEPGD